MKKVPLMIAVGIVGMIALGFTALAIMPSDNKFEGSLTNQTAASEKAAAPATSQTAAQAQTPAPTAQPGSYADYSADAFANAPGARILFFHAPWCGQCRQLDADMKNTAIPAGYSIFKIDYDDNQALRQKYEVTFRTSFVKIDASGNKVGKNYIAYNEPTFAAVMRDFL